MKKALLRLALVAVAGIGIAAFIGYRQYTRPHRSAASAQAVAVTAAQLVADYNKDEAIANKKYLGNAVQVTGTVSETASNQQHKQVVTIAGDDMGGVQCSLQEAVPDLRKGDRVTIKGFCSGFLTDVILDRCIVIP